VRSHTRPAGTSGTAISAAQASTLTLTLAEASLRPIQVWIRTSGKLDAAGKTLTATLRGSDANAVKVGQRVRCFSVASRFQMHQGKVASVATQGNVTTVKAILADQLENDGSRLLLEIVADRGDYLSVPNVSIIEEGDRHVVYVDGGGGRYTARDVRTGIQGELYTQILGGLMEGDQVVSIGSFFIDAENKLKSPGDGMSAMEGMDHGSMPGMNMSPAPAVRAGRTAGRGAMFGMDHSQMRGMTPRPNPVAEPK
jgi:multidrug efflux pump subunit AcrA (membrane-fusion protein)